MLNAMYGSLKAVLKKPHGLVIPFVASLLSAYFFILFVQIVIEILLDEVVYANILQESVFATLMFIVKVKSAEFLKILALALANSWLGIFVGIYYCKFIAIVEKASAFSKAVKFAFKSLWDSIALLIISIIFFAAFGVGAYIMLWLFGFNFLLSFFALLFLGLFMAIVGLRLFMFALPALAYEKINARKALQRSWYFTEEFFWQSLALAIVLTFIVFLIFALQQYILNFFDDTLAILIIYSLFNSFVVAFSFGTLSIYYAERHSKAK